MTHDEIAAHEPEIVALAQRLPYKPLTEDHRRRLAAEVMAQADVGEVAVVRSRRRGWALAGIVAAAAAIAVIVVLLRDPNVQAPAFAVRAEPEMLATPDHATAVLDVPAADPAAVAGVHGVVRLNEGSLAIDTRAREPVTVVVGTTRVTIASSRATIVVHQGVIVTAQVFAGTAQITEPGHTRTVEAGEIWTPSPAVSSFEAFRVGYEALRAGKYADAIAWFDRATDPVVVEDARFWAAIASERAGNHDDAARRLRAFMTAFPASPRLDDARSALERVTR